MNAHDTEKNNATGQEQLPRRHRPLGLRILLWLLTGVASLIVLVVAFLGIATWWLTPERLTSLINREASSRLNADVKAVGVDYTLWSTFPHLRVRMDSLYVRSRNFDSIPDTLRRQLPADADFLLSLGRTQAGVNLLRLFGGRFYLSDIEVERPSVNLVAATDSLNNYSLVSAEGSSKIPYFHIDGLRISRAGTLGYTSLPAQTEVGVGLAGLTLTPDDRKDHNSYAMRMQGEVTAASNGVDILRDFPFSLDGNVALRFRPFGVSTTDYRVSLGRVTGRVTMDVEVGDTARINNFAFRLDDVTLRNLLQMLPAGRFPQLNRVDADMTLCASARLTSPYNFSSGYLPSADVEISVPGGSASYTFDDGSRYEISDLTMNGNLVFDGRHPDKSYFDLERLDLRGYGTSLSLRGRVTDLTGNPHIAATLDTRSDLRQASRGLPMLRPYALSGDIDLRIGTDFTIAGDKLYSPHLDLEGRSGRLAFSAGPCDVEIDGFEISGKEAYDDQLTASSLLDRIPVGLKAIIRNARITDRRDALTVNASDLNFDGKAVSGPASDALRDITGNLGIGSVSLRQPAHTTTLRNVGLGIAASELASPVRTPSYKAPASWSSDARTLSFASHSPELIHFDLPAAVADIMSRWHARLDLKVGSGDMKIKGYNARNTLRDLALTATFDSVRLHRLTLSSGISRGHISGRISNLRQFLASKTPAPLYADLNVGFDTVQINQIARAYTDANPESAIARGDREAMAAGVDTVAMLIPRNIRARVHARAAQTQYTNLKLNNLLAEVNVADGRLDVDTIRLSSSFGAASASFVYDTRDMQRMSMDLIADVEQINLVRFFEKFHKLLEMMPEMKNVSGDFSARMAARLYVFPKMYADIPSARAALEVLGRNLQIKQTPFIRHITRMLMMPDEEIISIDNIDIRAGVHANLLELYPFTFKVSNYELSLMGVNNFNGDIYYHVGVEKWPLKLPFGINIKGSYHHPQLRFGGKDWHDGNGFGITQGVMDFNQFNIVHEGRRMMGEFVHSAATYTGD